MILSFSRRFLFIAVPKVAGHALRAMLRPQLDARDWEQCALFEQKRVPIPQIAAIGHGHVRAAELRPFVPAPIWDGLHKAAFVRHPIDRFVSFAYFINRGNERMRRDPLGGMKALLANPEMSRRIHLRPQYEFVCDANGDLMMDFVGHYEQLERDARRLMEALGLPFAPLAVVNAGPRPAEPPAMDREVREALAERYAEDFRRFDYSAEAPRPAARQRSEQ